MITSLQNPRVKDTVRLRQRKHRDESGQFVIDGARELARALAAGIEVPCVFVCEALLHTDEARRVVERLAERTCERVDCTPPVFEKLAFGQRAEGVLAVARTPARSLDAMRLSGVPLVAVVEGVEKPGNLGAVLRSADAAGLSAVIAVDPRTDLYNPNTIRASLGTIFTVPVCASGAEQAIGWLKGQGVQIIAARPDARRLYTEVDLTLPTAIVLGSEAAGLTATWNAPQATPIRLPMHGQADSLNLSATAAVLFYEALRQRQPRLGCAIQCSMLSPEG